MTSNPAHTSVKWVKTLNNANTDVEVTGRFSGATVNGPSLTISNSVNSDGGYYTCYATNSIGTGQSQSTFLNVIGSKSYLLLLTFKTSIIILNFLQWLQKMGELNHFFLIKGIYLTILI